MRICGRLTAALAIACLVVTIVSAGAAPNYLQLRVLGKLQSGNKYPSQDVLTPIWREKTKVKPEIIEIPTGQDYREWLQMQIVAGTFPDIIAATNGIFDNNDIYQMLKKSGMLRPITLAEMKKYMPLTAKRLKKYNVTIEEWYKANVDASDGKLYFIPNLPSHYLVPEYRNKRICLDRTGISPYQMWLRDDILKKIFPQAKTEAELKALWLKKGILSYEDVSDIPIRNAQDLYDYLVKVKKLNLKVGNNPVIPCMPIFMTSEASALMWSMFTFPGFWWSDLADRPYSDSTKSMVYFAATPEWKSWIKWMNDCYNEGLIHPEIFSMNMDQNNAKVINGEYAVFQRWLPANDARTRAEQEGRGYGFRVLSTFMIPLKTKYQDLTEYTFSLRSNWGAVSINPKSVKEKDIPQILRWIDWNYSEEAAELRAWGPPYMSTGSGEKRRFKPEYKELETYALTGKIGGRDGPYYGLYPFPLDHDIYWNHETYGIAASGESEYPYSPQMVYPLDDKSWDCFRFSDWAFKDYYARQRKIVIEGALGQDAMDARAAFDKIEEEFNKMKQTVGADCDAAKLAVIKAITGKKEDFEANYAAYLKIACPPELLENVEKQKEAWFRYRELRKKYLKVVK